MALVNIALYCSKAEIRVPGGGGWCKPIFVSNPQPSCFGLLLGWVAVAWLGFGVMTTKVNYNGVKTNCSVFVLFFIELNCT